MFKYCDAAPLSVTNLTRLVGARCVHDWPSYRTGTEQNLCAFQFTWYTANPYVHGFDMVRPFHLVGLRTSHDGHFMDTCTVHKRKSHVPYKPRHSLLAEVVRHHSACPRQPHSKSLWPVAVCSNVLMEPDLSNSQVVTINRLPFGDYPMALSLFFSG